MVKSNRDYRDNLAKEMRNKYNERNEQLEQIDKLPLTEAVKKSARKDIMEAFYKEMEEFKKRPWYEEAKKTHLEEIKAKVWLNEAKKEKERLQKEYEEKMAKADENIADKTKSYEDAQIAHRWEIEYWEIKKELIWNYEAVEDDLLKNHLNVKENSEYMWLKWKEIHLTIPAVWKFKWFKFDCFISDDDFNFVKVDEDKSAYGKKSDHFYEIDDLCKLWEALQSYFEEYNAKCYISSFKISEWSIKNILTTTVWMKILSHILWARRVILKEYDEFCEENYFYNYEYSSVTRTIFLNQEEKNQKEKLVLKIQ